MGVYITSINDEVLPLLGGRSVDTTTTPSTADVEDLILQAEALLEGALAAGGISTPITGTGPTRIMKACALDYVIGHVRQSHAAAGGDGDNEDGEPFLERFYAKIEDIMARPALYEGMLGGSGSTPSSTKLRGHPTDDVDGRTSTDFAPEFTRDMDW